MGGWREDWEKEWVGGGSLGFVERMQEDGLGTGTGRTWEGRGEVGFGERGWVGGERLEERVGEGDRCEEGRDR